jgi:plastocyanin
MNRRKTRIADCAYALLMALIVTVGGCKSSSATAPTPATTTTVPGPGGGGGGGGTTFTISNNTVSPSVITVSVGTRVTFINNDSRTHEMHSDPHPEHTDCPALNDIGFLQPNQMRATGNLNTPGTCGFHDHNLPDVAGLKGRIIIQ